MASSGTITGSTNNSHYTLTCEWSSTQNSSANTSTITANVYLNGNGYSTVSSYWCCTINGTEVTTNWSGTVSGKTKLGSRTWTVSHNSNGSCTTNISFPIGYLQEHIQYRVVVVVQVLHYQLFHVHHHLL